MQNGSSVRNVHTLRTRFCRLFADLHAQSMIVSKFSESELRQKFIKHELLVGKEEERERERERGRA